MLGKGSFNLTNIITKTHIQHAVCLIENKEFHLGKIDIFLTDVIQ